MSFLDEVLARMRAENVDFATATVLLPDSNAEPAFIQAVNAFAQKHKTPCVVPIIATLQGFCEPWVKGKIATRLTLLLYLHRAYEQTLGTVLFERVSGRLEQILADFDEIDSQLLPVDQVFKSLVAESEVKVQFSEFFTKEEEEIVRQYWQHFSQKNLKAKDEAELRLYKALPAIYTSFTAQLAEVGLLYRGLFYRKVHAYLAAGGNPKLPGKVYMAGFNKLSNSQIQIAEVLSERGVLHFITDTLLESKHPTESTYYQRQHGRNSKLVKDEIGFTPSLLVQTVVRGSGGAAGIATIMQKLVLEHVMWPEKRIVVLTSEYASADLATDLLKQQGVEAVNMHHRTVAGTPLFALLEALQEIQAFMAASYATDVPVVYIRKVWHNPVWLLLLSTKGLEPYKNLGQKKASVTSLAQVPIVKNLLNGDAPKQAWQAVLAEIAALAVSNQNLINTLNAAAQALDALDAPLQFLGTVSHATFWKLWANEMAQAQITPAATSAGVRVADLADVQAQDFESLYFLDAVEGKLPTQLPRGGAIPPILRHAWGITTQREDAAHQAYLFYRLLKRAQTAIYYINEVADDASWAEPSRYLRQLKAFQDVSFTKATLSSVVAKDAPHVIAVEKSPAIMQKLATYLANKPGESGPELFPTRISKYLRCGLQFYLAEILGLKEASEESETIDGAMFGNLLHNTIEELYKPYFIDDTKITTSIPNSDRIAITTTIIEQLKANAAQVLRKNMAHDFALTDPSQLDDYGYVSAAEHVLVLAIQQLLQRDEHRAPFFVIKLESKLIGPLFIAIQTNEGVKYARLNGKFDRVDQLSSGQTEVVDFKTGSKVEVKFATIDQIFETNNAKDFKEAFQILTYAWQLAEVQNLNKVAPTVVRLGALFTEKGEAEAHLFHIGNEAVIDIASYNAQMKLHWTKLLEEIFNTDTPFSQTPHLETCQYCSFVKICNR